jgi:peptidyl-prolyl cis-trans isomerase C
MTRKPVFGRALLLVLALPVLMAAQEGDGRVVAEVGGRQILASDVRDRLMAERKQAAAENRLDAFGSKASALALDQLVDVKLFAAQARGEGLADRADVKHAIENAVDAVLAQTLVGERAQKVPTDEAALRAYYDAHPTEFETPGRVRARHIVVKTEAEATALLGKLKRNADFVQLARANNIDATRENGGDLGPIKRGVMVEAFERALFSLKAGETSPVIRTPYGYHIVRVEDIEPAARAPFNAVAADVRTRVLQAQLQAWKAEIVKTHAVKINEQVLKSIQ